MFYSELLKFCLFIYIATFFIYKKSNNLDFIEKKNC